MKAAFSTLNGNEVRVETDMAPGFLWVTTRIEDEIVTVMVSCKEAKVIAQTLKEMAEMWEG